MELNTSTNNLNYIGICCTATYTKPNYYMLQNLLLKTKHLLLFTCLCVLIFGACRIETDIPPIMELTTEDRRNIAESILDLITANENYEILDKNEYAEAYAYLDNYVSFMTNSTVLEHRTDYNWTAYIIGDETGTNAFTTPGGYIYFDKGLLKRISSEAAFMHFLANEISYADKGFVSKKLQDNYGLQLLLDLALGSTVETAEELLNTLYNKPYDQNSVEQADDFMLELACEKEYDAGLFKSFLQNNDTIVWLETHPTNSLDTRLNLIRDYECVNQDSVGVTMDTYSEFLSKL